MAHIPLPDNLLSRLRHAAQQEGLSLTRFFEQMLDLYLENHQRRENFEPVDDAAVKSRFLSDPLHAEVDAFRRLHPELLESYLNQYVAIFQGKLVDHDADKLALYKRIEVAYPNDFVLMRPVLEQPEREFYFRSPRYFRFNAFFASSTCVISCM